LLYAQDTASAVVSGARPWGEIRGRLKLSAKEAPHAEHLRDPLLGVYGPRAEREAGLLGTPPGAPTSKLSEKAVLYLESAELDRRRYGIPDRRPVLNQSGLQFHPLVLPILVGSTVDFPNRDNLFHNVFSYSHGKEFDLGRYPKDDSRSVTFETPGIVRVYCDIHSHMHATILVLEHPYFTMPDDEGNYVLARVPEGRHTIVLWYDRDVAERRTVNVRAGESITLDFTN
jgi:plastocyanin